VAAALGLLAAVQGCSNLVVTDPDSPHYVPRPGSRVIVKQRIEVPPGHTRVFFQHGKQIDKQQLNDYDINCNLEITTLSDQPRYIEPGSYTVIRTDQYSDEVVSRGPLLFAALDVIAVRVRDDGGDGPSMIYEGLRMVLDRSTQTELRELACRGALGDPSEVVAPSLAEMRKALGKSVAIEVAEEGGA
jgi:hypothetical protein